MARYKVSFKVIETEITYREVELEADDKEDLIAVCNDIDAYDGNVTERDHDCDLEIINSCKLEETV